MGLKLTIVALGGSVNSCSSSLTIWIGKTWGLFWIGGWTIVAQGAGTLGDAAAPLKCTGESNNPEDVGTFLFAGSSGISMPDSIDKTIGVADFVPIAKMLLKTLKFVFILFAAQKLCPPSNGKKSNFLGSETAPSEGRRSWSLTATDCSICEWLMFNERSLF